MKRSLIKNAIKFYREEGARNTIARSLHRLAGSVEIKQEAPPLSLDPAGFFPPEAMPFPVRKVANTSGRKRLSLVLPTVNQEHLYAGAWTALKIFWKAGRKNDFRLRIISANSPFSTEGLEKLDFVGPGEIGKIESWQREGNVPCDVEDDEIFIVTAWWTAYVIRELENTNRIFYLVQDFEPGFYSWSYHYVLALESYKFKYAKIFNTPILYEFFKEQKLLSGEDEVYFEPGIDTKLFNPGDKAGQTADIKAGYKKTGKATILLYGRPAVTRNLFELAILSLDHFLNANPSYREKIQEIISVGEKHDSLVAGGFRIESRGKMSMTEWARMARESDIGISLMCSPHPSYPPLEMVASGMLVVTNRIYNKDLSTISDNFIAADMNIEDIAGAIKTAIDKLEDQESIRRNAETFISERDWDQNLMETTEFISEKSSIQEG